MEPRKQDRGHLGHRQPRQPVIWSLLLLAYVQLFANFTEYMHILGNCLKCKCTDPQRFRRWRAEARCSRLSTFAACSQPALCQVILQSLPLKKQNLSRHFPEEASQIALSLPHLCKVLRLTTQANHLEDESRELLIGCRVKSLLHLFQGLPTLARSQVTPRHESSPS